MLFRSGSVFDRKEKKNIVVVVCGGSKDSLDDIWAYEQQEEKGRVSVQRSRIHVDGREV